MLALMLVMLVIMLVKGSPVGAILVGKFVVTVLPGVALIFF